MTTLARAWEEFMRVIEETRAMHQRGAQANTTMIVELIHYARDLLESLPTKSLIPTSTVPAARAVLAQLRSRLESLERDVTSTQH
jgi:hypothetical protein